MKRKVLFVSDWPDNVKNGIALQKLLEKEYSDNYEWTVWSCKKKANNNVSYRWRCYFKGALYVIRNRKKYDAIFIWQQMVGYVFFELRKFIPFKTPAVVLFTFIYNSDNIFGKYKKHFVKGALRYSKGVIWPSSEMADEVKKDFPKYRSKNHFTLMPMFDIIDNNIPVEETLDDPKFRNGVFTAGKSERDFNIVIRAFKNTSIPVTIVCPDDYPITETGMSDNIRILPFSKVSHEQYYALINLAFCVLISVVSEKSPCGQLLISYAMSSSKPIIATNCYGVRDFIVNNENGLLFQVGQSKEILGAYEKLKKDEAFTNNLVKKARQTAGEMSPNNFIPRIISIMEN